jgi:hypothetical protein
MKIDDFGLQVGKYRVFHLIGKYEPLRFHDIFRIGPHVGTCIAKFGNWVVMKLGF